MDRSSTVNVAGVGWTRAVTQEFLADAANTVGYVYDEKRNRQAVKFAAPANWSAMNEVGKSEFWTIQEGDYLINDECPVNIPPDAISALTGLNPSKIQSINTVRQKGRYFPPSNEKDGTQFINITGKSYAAGQTHFLQAAISI